jgi:transcriptional regulator with XRE-family HTH domain
MRYEEIAVDMTSDLAEFLTSRRAKITPEQAGLPSYGKRRVPGLRREEVASLAGVSIEYYRRLERGRVSGVSDSVLEALSRALRGGRGSAARWGGRAAARGDDASASPGWRHGRGRRVVGARHRRAVSASQQALDLLASWAATPPARATTN